MASRLMVALVGGLSGERKTSFHCQHPSTLSADCIDLCSQARVQYTRQEARALHELDCVGIEVD